MLAAAVAGAYGYERLRPSHAPRPENASNEAREPPAPGAAVAALAPAPPAAIEAPARMSPTQEAAFEAWLIKTYLGCWKPAAPPAGADPYVAQGAVAFRPDGSLDETAAKLVNPPSDPAQKPQAKSVIAPR